MEEKLNWSGLVSQKLSRSKKINEEVEKDHVWKQYSSLIDQCESIEGKHKLLTQWKNVKSVDGKNEVGEIQVTGYVKKLVKEKKIKL